jgi:hypothetical protein
MAAGGGRFYGVRHATGWDADPITGNSLSNPRRGEFIDWLGTEERSGLVISIQTVFTQPGFEFAQAHVKPSPKGKLRWSNLTPSAIPGKLRVGRKGASRCAILSKLIVRPSF